MMFLLVIKKFFSSIFSFLISNPKVILWIIIIGVIGYLYMSNLEKDKEITNLNSQIKILTINNTTLTTSLKEANSSIKEQNASIKKVSDTLESLNTEVEKTKLINIELEKKVKNSLDYTAPVSEKDNFIWLHDKANGIQEWAD